jgi:L-seryl-tRNA(Ser) seleniumtransferase
LLEGRGDEVPARALMLLEPAELAARAARIRAGIARLAGFRAEEVEATSQPGSGSAPGVFLPTRAVRVAHTRASAGTLARALRLGEPAVFARVQDDALLLDPRTLLPGDEARLLDAFGRLEATLR